MEGSRGAKGDRGGLGGGATVNGLEAWRLGKLQLERCDRAEEHQEEVQTRESEQGEPVKIPPGGIVTVSES